MIWAKRTFNLILTLAAMLTMAQTAWATDPVVKTFLLSSATRSDDYMSLLMNDPDDNNAQKTVIIANCNREYARIRQGTSGGSSYKEIRNLRLGGNGISAADVPVLISPYINGKVSRIEFTKMGRYAQNLFNSSTEQLDIPNVFSMSISGMKYNGTEDALTGNGTMNGNTMTEKESFSFISTNAEGIEGDINIQLGAGSQLILWNNCEIKITYIPSAAPVHTHDFTYTAVGNTLTATCGGTDGLECSLTNHQISTSLNADDSFDSDPAMIFPATLTGFTFFSKETGATKGNITYVNNTTSENLGTTTPNDPGQYTASITINAGGTNYTLTKTYNVYAYAQINNIYPQLNFSTEKYASTTAAGANETVTITFTSKFGETLESLTVTGATTHDNVTLTQTGANTYSFTMPSENVTIGATFSISEDDFEQSGDTYTIKTANGWGWFCFAVNYDLAPDGFSGKTVKLGTSIGSSEMAGTSSHPFKGTFDGDGKTLTFNLTASEGHSAPFHYTNGATIRNLHVEGTITGGDNTSLGGLVGYATGNITIENCRVSTQISTTHSGAAWHGGVIAFWYDSNVACTVTGCVYDGLIYNPSEADATSYCRGFIGNLFGSNLTVTFTDCLYAPAAYGTGKNTLGDECNTFVYPNSSPTYNMTNCYYTTALGKRQGRPAATATDAPANLGDATTEHGLVKGYLNGFLYNGNYYTPKYGDAVVEYVFNDYWEHADVTINGQGNNLVGVNITEEVGNVTSVTYNRTFTSGVAAAVILPFDYTCNGNEGGSFYSFAGISDTTPVMEDGNHVTSLTVNTPYLFVPTATAMTFPNISNMTGGVVTLKPTAGDHTVTSGDWTLTGIYAPKTWTGIEPDYDNAFILNSIGRLNHIFIDEIVKPTDGYFVGNGITYTVTFDANGGTGTIAAETVTGGATYTLPACTFTAPEGKTFFAWSVKIGDAEAVNKQPGDTITVTADTTVKALWKAAKPVFASHSLVLSGQIGVNFFMDLRALSDAERVGTYMTFTISGAGSVPSEPVYFDASLMNSDLTYHKFTCYVNSIQMADTITATYHWFEDGVEKTVSEDYSIRQYISAFDAKKESFDATTVALVHALADYGHYVQIFLDANNDNWSVGKDYAEMDLHFANSYDIDTIKAAVSGYAIDKVNNTGGDIETITYSLVLDSETAIKVYFKPSGNYTGTPAVTVGNQTYTATKTGGKYVVMIPKISAHKLIDSHTIAFTTTNGTATVTVSALSYVKGALDYYSDDDSQNAMAAIYAYSKAAQDFIAAH